MTNVVYFATIENLTENNVVLEHARIDFINANLIQIEFEYDENIDIVVKQEAEYFDRLTYKF